MGAETEQQSATQIASPHKVVKVDQRSQSAFCRAPAPRETLDDMSRPGDYILDKYMPAASTEQREEARENLYALAAVVVRICERIARERQDAIRAKRRAEVESGHSLTSTV